MSSSRSDKERERLIRMNKAIAKQREKNQSAEAKAKRAAADAKLKRNMRGED